MSTIRKIVVTAAIFGSAVSAECGTTETEIFVGVATTTLGSTVEPGVGVGGGLGRSILTFHGGSIDARLSVMPVFVSTQDQGLDVARLDIPLSVAISFLERPTAMAGMGLGGSIGFGMMTIVGRDLASGSSFMPCATIDLTFGVFKRGALKVRYTAVFGDATSTSGEPLRYQSLVVIGSTAW
jgi:hypothetical protein